MTRKSMYGLSLIVVALLLTAMAARSEAQLGCDTVNLDVVTGGLPVRQGVATCSVAADCAFVGGIDCTAGGFCYCPNSVTDPFCHCAAAPAPTVSHAGLLGLAAMLITVGLLHLWRRGSRTRPAAG
jgi:hypothetical protein